MKAARAALAPEDRARQSADACARLAAHPQVAALIEHPDDPRYLAIFNSFGTEIALAPLIAAHPNLHVAVPVVLGPHHMEFVSVTAQTLLAPRAQQPPFLSAPAARTTLPQDAQVIAPHELAVMVLPGLAFDEKGGRLGYGGGFYDAYLERARAKSPHEQDAAAALAPVPIAFCFDEQVVVHVPCEPSDQRVSWIVTPTRTLACAR